MGTTLQKQYQEISLSPRPPLSLQAPSQVLKGSASDAQASKGDTMKPMQHFEACNEVRFIQSINPKNPGQLSNLK